jgi:hypothetical protein
MTLAHFGQEYAHRLSMHGRKHERVQGAVMGTESRKRILILPNDLHTDFGPHPGRSPAAAWITAAPETRFVLKHQADRQALVRQSSLRGYLFLDQFG